MSITELPTGKGYNLWAEQYETNANPMTGLDEIVFLKQFPLQNIKAKTVLDIGCGTGRLSRQIAKADAKVIGIDISEKMLEQERKKDSTSTYIHYKANNAFPFEQKFDFITSNLVLEHINNLDFFFKEIARVSLKTSFIYISAMHPAMLLKGTQANFKDAKTGKEFRPKGYPHQIADFVQSMNNSDLLITKMNEYNGTKKLVAKFPKAERYLNWPMLLTFELRKL